MWQDSKNHRQRKIKRRVGQIEDEQGQCEASHRAAKRRNGLPAPKFPEIASKMSERCMSKETRHKLSLVSRTCLRECRLFPVTLRPLLFKGVSIFLPLPPIILSFHPISNS